MNTDNKASAVKKNIIRIAAVALIAAVLAFAYFSAEDIPQADDSFASTDAPTAAATTTSLQTAKTDDAVRTELSTVSSDPPTEKTDVSVPDRSSALTSAPPATVTSSSSSETKPPKTTVTAKTSVSASTPPAAKTCAFTISCASAVGSPDKLSPGVIDILPSDGIIFPLTDVPLQEGDTVYDVLARICKQNGIHIETQRVAATDSVYIEGIANLYEFDAGALSGWMFSVDGKFPRTSCSAYKLTGGERVEILYSCNIGADVGDDYFSR